MTRDDLLRAEADTSLPSDVRGAAHTLLGQFPDVSSSRNGFDFFTQRDLDRVRRERGLGTWGGP